MIAVLVLAILGIVAYLVHRTTKYYEKDFKIVQYPLLTQQVSHRYPMVIENEMTPADLKAVFWGAYKLVVYDTAQAVDKYKYTVQVRCNYMIITQSPTRAVSLSHPDWDPEERVDVLVPEGYTLLVPRWWGVTVPQDATAYLCCNLFS
jgi:hypothetical protein